MVRGRQSKSSFRDVAEVKDDLNYDEDPMDLENINAPSSGWYASGGELSSRYGEDINERYKNQQGMPREVVHQNFFNNFEDDFDDENLK